MCNVDIEKVQFMAVYLCAHEVAASNSAYLKGVLMSNEHLISYENGVSINLGILVWMIHHREYFDVK